MNQEDCWAATGVCSQIYGKSMVYEETLLDGLHASTSTTYHRQENEYRCKSLNNSKTFAVSGSSTSLIRWSYWSSFINIRAWSVTTVWHTLIRRENQRTLPHSQWCQARLPRLPLRHDIRPYLSMAPRLDHPRKSRRSRFSSTLSVCLCCCFDVAASSFRTLMTAPSPTFVVVEQVAGHNLNHQKCCWFQYGSDSCHELLNWVSTNCEEFRERKIKYAKYVGTLIGTEGYFHRWTALRKISSAERGKSMEPPKTLLTDWATSKYLPCLYLDI